MKSRLITLVMILSFFVFGLSSLSFSQDKAPKKTHHKTMMMDSTKAKTNKMKSTKTATHKTHKMAKTTKTSMKPKKDTTSTK